MLKPWHNIGSFQEVVKKVSSLFVINNTAERGVALIQDYNKLLIKQEDQLQFLLQTVAAHRTAFSDSLKSTLPQNSKNEWVGHHETPAFEQLIPGSARGTWITRVHRLTGWRHQ